MRRLGLTWLGVLLLPVCGGAQVFAGSGETLVLRNQAAEIAGEIVPGLKLDPPGRVVVFVEGGQSRVLIENAFLGELRRIGASTGLRTDRIGSDTVLHLVVLDQGSSWHALTDSLSARSIRTIVEARLEVPGGDVRILGTFRRINEDTVRVSPARMETGTAGVFDTILVPLVMLGSVILMTYLFFTVRS